jgi:hypothetical protein
MEAADAKIDMLHNTFLHLPIQLSPNNLSIFICSYLKLTLIQDRRRNISSEKNF